MMLHVPNILNSFCWELTRTLGQKLGGQRVTLGRHISTASIITVWIQTSTASKLKLILLQIHSGTRFTYICFSKQGSLKHAHPYQIVHKLRLRHVKRIN